MHAYILRRLLALLPTLFFASVIVFVIVRLVPGDVVDLMLSQNDISANALTREQLLQTRGLNKPLWEQYLIWTGRILFHGDLGKSLWQNVPVLELVVSRLPATFSLGLMA